MLPTLTFFLFSRHCVFKWSAFQKSSILVMPFIEFIICLGSDPCLGTFWWLPIISFMVNPWWIILLFWLTEQKFYLFLWDIIDLSHSACKLLKWTQFGQWIAGPNLGSIDTVLYSVERIFPSLRLYVKSIFESLEVVKLPFLPF